MNPRYYSVMIDVPYFEGYDCIKIDYPESGDYFEDMGMIKEFESDMDMVHKKIIYVKREINE